MGTQNENEEEESEKLPEELIKIHFHSHPDPPSLHLLCWHTTSTGSELPSLDSLLAKCIKSCEMRTDILMSKHMGYVLYKELPVTGERERDVKIQLYILPQINKVVIQQRATIAQHSVCLSCPGWEDQKHLQRD